MVWARVCVYRCVDVGVGVGVGAGVGMGVIGCV